MDKLARMSLLLDIYGPLLTEKQLTCMEMYFNNDLSLGEIAESNSTSRQAVFDIIKRGEKILDEYEEKLGLLDKFMKERQKLNLVADILNDFKNKRNIDDLDKAMKLLTEVLELETT